MPETPSDTYKGLNLNEQSQRWYETRANILACSSRLCEIEILMTDKLTIALMDKMIPEGIYITKVNLHLIDWAILITVHFFRMPEDRVIAETKSSLKVIADKFSSIILEQFPATKKNIQLELKPKAIAI